MNQSYHDKKAEAIAVILLGISILLGVLILFKVTGLFVTPTKAKNLVERTISKSDVNDIGKHLPKNKEVIDELKKNNLFAPTPPRQHPVKEAWGILGDEVLIEGKWYKVGDMIQDAKIVAIEATQVRIKWNGNEKAFAPIDAVASASGPGKPRPPGLRAKEMDKTAIPPIERAEITVPVPPMELMQRPEGMGRFRFPPPEERERLRQRFENMSEEERQEFRERMRERFGGRRRRQVEQ